MSATRKGKVPRSETGLESLRALVNRVAFSAGSIVRLSIGFFTWLAAARLYPATQVGQAASAISAMLVCVEVCVLGIDVAFLSLFPQHRTAPKALLNTAITLAALCSLGGGVIVLGLGAAGFHALHFLIATPLAGAAFLLLIAFQSGWWLLDQAAIALHRSDHVPVRALVAALTTLSTVALLGAAGDKTAGAILVAWTVAAVVACALGLWQVERAIPGFRLRLQLVAPLRRQLLSIGLPNFAVTAADVGPGLLLPIIAAQQLSSRAAAYWYTVWMMAFAAYSIPWSFGLHLFAELADNPSELARRSAQTLRSGIAIAATAAAGLIVLGPTILSILGPRYEAHGAGPLRIAATAAIPMVLFKSYLYTCRAVGRVREGALAAGLVGVSALVLAVLTAPGHGLTGIALSWLGVQCAGAVWGGLRLRGLTARMVTAPPEASAALAPEEVLSLRRGDTAISAVLDEEPGGRAPQRIDRAQALDWLQIAAPILIGAGWAVSLTALHLQRMTDLGLISAMPLSTLLALALLTVSFAITVTRRPFNAAAALIHVLVLVIALYGITEFVEAEPRFSSVYRHVGIIDNVIGHRSIKSSIDAYFDWPGFFSLGALVTKLAGWRSALAFAAWGPLLFNLLYLPPLLAIFSWATEDRRVRYAALWVFYSANWVGQDYISPQGIAFFLWLAILALVLHWFTPRPARLGSAATSRAVLRDFGPRALRALAREDSPAGVAQSIGVLLTVLVLYGAIVSGHQLTPVPAIITIAGLVLLAGCTARGLPVLMILGLAVWIGFMTVPYLTGHISQVFGGLGGVGANVSQGVGGRLAGSSGHQLIAKLRIVMSLAIWLLAAGGFLRRLRARRGDLAMAIIGLASFLMPLLQPYGGEIFLRVFLFTLPGVGFFTALLAFPVRGASARWPTALAIALIGCLLLLGFQYTRYGNEAQDNFTRGDLALVSALDRIAPRGSRLMSGTDNLPWRDHTYAGYTFLTMETLRDWSTRAPDPATLIVQAQRELGSTGGYLIINRSTEIYASNFDGLPGILPRVDALLRSSPVARRVFHSADGDIFFLRGP